MRLCLLLSLTLLLSFTKSEAQNPFPLFSDNTSWNVKWCYFAAYCFTDTVYYEKDTLLCGQTYSKINLSNNVTGYIRNSGQKTYCRKNSNCSNREYLLYDFSLSIGDTVYTGNHLYNTYPIDTIPFRLTAITNIDFMGFSRRQFEMTAITNSVGNPEGASMHWVEGVGSDINPFHSFFCLETSFCESSYQTLCMSQNGVQQYQNPDVTGCLIEGLGITQPVSDKISVFPNPFSRSLFISMQNIPEPESVSIYNAFGSLVESYTEINLQSGSIEIGKNLPPGMYWLSLKSEAGYSTLRIIKDGE